MDMFNLQSKPDAADNDSALKRQVQAAFSCEEPPIPAATLLERILVKAEAMPQAAPEGCDAVADIIAEAEELSPSVAMQQRKASQAKVTTSHHRVQQMRQSNWQLYHQYLERQASKVNVVSGIQL